MSDKHTPGPSPILALVILTSVIAMTLAILRWVPRPDNTYLWLEIYNWGHIWLFTMVMLVSIWGVRYLLPKLKFGIVLLIACLLCALLGAASEILQIEMTGRNADLEDFGRDLTGIAAALAGVLVWRHRREPSQTSLRNAVLSLVIFIPMLTVATWPVISMLRAYEERNPALPVLFSPDAAWSRPFVRNVRSKLSYDRPPDGFDDFTGKHCLHFRTKTQRYSGVEFPDLYPNWSDYSTLHIEIWSGAKTMLPFLIRLDAARYPYLTDDWANIHAQIQPGSNHISVNLDSLVNAGTGAQLDRSHIYSIVVVNTDETHRHNLCFGTIRLSK